MCFSVAGITLNCEGELKMYSNLQGHYDRGETFPCHYSKLNPWMVIEKFKRDELEIG